MQINLDIFKKAKELQKETKNSVVKVVYKNYQGYVLESEPVELAIIKSSLGLMSQSSNSFLTNVKGKYAGK